MLCPKPIVSGHSTCAIYRPRPVHQGKELCRVDVAGNSKPVWAKTSKNDRVFYVRLNNSTRAIPADEIDAYTADRWPQ